MAAALEEDFARFALDPDADELGGAVLVARLIEPGLDGRALAGSARRLAARCRGPRPWDTLAAAGLRGNTEAYGALDNSHLGRVLDSGKGLPITLAVLLIEAARQSGARALGINFPTHFLVQVDELLVDPFRLQLVKHEACRSWLPEALRRQSDAELFAPASAQTVTLRMLNNVKGIWAAQSAWHQVLEAIDAQCAMAPAQPEFEVERGELWLRLGSIGSARDAFERALALTAGGATVQARALADALRGRLAALRGAGDVLH